MELDNMPNPINNEKDIEGSPQWRFDSRIKRDPSLFPLSCRKKRIVEKPSSNEDHRPSPQSSQKKRIAQKLSRKEMKNTTVANPLSPSGKKQSKSILMARVVEILEVNLARDRPPQCLSSFGVMNVEDKRGDINANMPPKPGFSNYLPITNLPSPTGVLDVDETPPNECLKFPANFQGQKSNAKKVRGIPIAKTSSRILKEVEVDLIQDGLLQCMSSLSAMNVEDKCGDISANKPPKVGVSNTLLTPNHGQRPPRPPPEFPSNTGVLDVDETTNEWVKFPTNFQLKKSVAETSSFSTHDPGGKWSSSLANTSTTVESDLMEFSLDDLWAKFSLNGSSGPFLDVTEASKIKKTVEHPCLDTRKRQHSKDNSWIIQRPKFWDKNVDESFRTDPVAKPAPSLLRHVGTPPFPTYILLSGAVVPIQSAIRRYLARREIYMRKYAVLVLQSTFSGWFARLSFIQQRSAAIFIQAATRRNQAHNKVLRRFISILVVQAAARGFLVRSRLLKLNFSAQKIQASWRCFRCYLAYQFDLLDIIIVQSVCRRQLARSYEQKLLAKISSRLRAFRPIFHKKKN